ncbi:MAG TPA: hypothetical protein VNN72_23885 [Polyangiaceae bacterium]|nr:hypothetical protein [Polyangiaceae bacterium]
MSDSRSRKPWYFDYTPLSVGRSEPVETDTDLVLATVDDVDPARIAELIGAGITDLSVTPLISSHPVFWTRVESTHELDFARISRALTAGGIGVRFITSARQGNQLLPPPLDFSAARPRVAREWPAREKKPLADVDSPWRWFLRGEGVDANRSLCGTGAGTRFALIDDDGLDLDKVDLDAEVLVGVPAIPRAQSHAAMLVGWAVRARRSDGSTFTGVAPDASPRVYCIPKPGRDVWSLPLAILRAVDDGADVIVCATYVEGTTSPLLDDALEVAARLGRGGRGAVVAMPTGREMSSSEGSVHSSLSLSAADPASDPRVFCVGPSARDGRWFLWRDRRGRLRPFANRGPAVRFMTPGDDMASPFAIDDRASHAESSGASAIAGATVLLVLEANPSLSAADVDAALRIASVEVDPTRQYEDPGLADRRDLEPLGIDPDGHNAKHGYGRLSASRACLVARDPFAQALVRIGELETAERYASLDGGALRPLLGDRVARFAARAALRDAGVCHAISAFMRTLRLAAATRVSPSEPNGQYLRQLGVVLRMLDRESDDIDIGPEIRARAAHLSALDGAAIRNLETELLSLFDVTNKDGQTPSCVVEFRDPARHDGGKASVRGLPGPRS